MYGGAIIIVLLVIFLGWCLGTVWGEWGLKRGAEAEKKNPQLLLDRISEGFSIHKGLNFSQKKAVMLL